jgi:uncharacterized membrane protein (UPF0136 family)
MLIQAITQLVYAILVLIGGIIGHYIANSMPSLVMGTIFAILLTASAIAMFQNIPLGFYSGVALTAILFVFFGYRYLTTMKVFPAGFMTLVSLVVLLILFFVKRK